MLPSELAGSLRVWVRENLADWAFDMTGLDRKAVDQALSETQEGLQAIEAAKPEPSRQDAEQMLAELSQFEETKQYATLLRTLIEPSPQTLQPTEERASPQPAQRPDNESVRPTPQQMRERWLGVVARRPAPSKANDYLPQIKPIFRSERVPAELAWMAEVESAFDPHAKSPVGAVGLFQLMPQTANSLGLSTWFPDERRDVEKNARAAAKYLQSLHARFGEWRLALAAYNAGPTRVSRLLRNSPVYGYDAIASQLPAETRNYVAKVEATLIVREGVELASLSHSEQ